MGQNKRGEKTFKAATPSNRVKVVTCIAVLLAGLGVWKFAGRQAVQATKLPKMATTEGLPVATPSFAPTVENKNAPAGSAPEGLDSRR